MEERKFVVLACIHALVVNSHERRCLVVKKNWKPEIHMKQSKELTHGNVFLGLCRNASFAERIKSEFTMLFGWMDHHYAGVCGCRQASNQPIWSSLARGDILGCDDIIFHYLSPAEKVLVTLIEGGEWKLTGLTMKHSHLSRSCFMVERMSACEQVQAP
jgi:hypothetical protein